MIDGYFIAGVGCMSLGFPEIIFFTQVTDFLWGFLYWTGFMVFLLIHPVRPSHKFSEMKAPFQVFSKQGILCSTRTGLGQGSSCFRIPASFI